MLIESTTEGLAEFHNLETLTTQAIEGFLPGHSWNIGIILAEKRRRETLTSAPDE